MKRRIILIILIIIIIIFVIGIFAIINRNKTERRTNDILKISESDSLNYTKSFDLIYNQSKDKEIDLKYNQSKDKEINLLYKTEKYSIKAFRGDVQILKQNKIYSLTDALMNNIITFNDILQQIDLDKKYGFCKVSEYLDEGSIEYLYENYTILEINEKNGNTDLIIGMKGSIIGDYKANIENYNTKEARDSYLNEINKNFHFQDSVED